MYRKAVLLATGGLAVALGLTPAMAEPPTVGACLPLTDRQWDRSTIPPVAAVDCNTPHTAEVMGVIPVPDKVWRSGSRAFWAWAFRKCHTVGVTYVWGNESAPLPVKSYARPMTAQLATYEPTSAQSRAGERWVACVGFNTTAKGRATPRTGSIAYTGLEPQFCVSGKTWRWQSCSARGSVAMTNVVWLKGYRAKYPGSAKALRLTKGKCTALARSRGLQLRAWYVPGKVSWNYGDHFGYCWIV